MQRLRKFATQEHFLKMCIMSTPAGGQISQIRTDINSLQLLTKQITALSKVSLCTDMELWTCIQLVHRDGTMHVPNVLVFNQEKPRMLLFKILNGVSLQIDYSGQNERVFPPAEWSNMNLSCGHSEGLISIYFIFA